MRSSRRIGAEREGRPDETRWLSIAARWRRRGRTQALAVLSLVALGGVALLLVTNLGSSGTRSSGTTPRPSTFAGVGGEKALSRPRLGTLPSARRIRSARRFAAERQGLVAFAVVDTSGNLACYRCDVQYRSASVVKAMLLVAYLNRLARNHEPLTADHEENLHSMVRVSDNNAATAIWAHVGERGLYKLAAHAQMTGFAVSDMWANARITAEDQALFFADIVDLTAPAYRGYARALLLSIAAEQSWGIPEVARPQWQVLFKGGWLTNERGSLVHQVARLERQGSSWAIAVLTDGNPSDGYGRETIRGIAKHLLTR
jgi:hypothetical protein